MLAVLAMMLVPMVVMAQDDAPTGESPVVVDVDLTAIPVDEGNSPDETPTDEETPSEDDSNTQEIVSLAKDIGMWGVFLVMLFLMRNSMPPSVYRDLLQERRERAAQTPTNLDNLAVEVAEKLLPILVPLAAKVKAETTSFDEMVRGG